MIQKRYFLLLLFCFFSIITVAQGGFQFYGNSNKKQSTKFKLINNLMVIPLTINGKELNFILDTGVSKTILFNLSQIDSIGLKNIKPIKLRGLGSGEPVDALISRNNKLEIKNLIGYNEELYVVLKYNFDISGKMGITIHGIIGYKLLKNVIAKINYNNKRIDFYNPKYYKYRKCRKCKEFPLQFHRNKPYIDVEAQLDTIGNTTTKVKLLIDSGGSDTFWLFEDSKKEIKTPKKYFNDVLGEGLSGTIYGNRSRIPKVKIGSFEIEKPTVSFLDTLSTLNARKFKERNGSIGGNILKRFRVWIDYPNKKLILRKKRSLKGGFNYNMSGLSIVYAGKELVSEKENTRVLGYDNSSNNYNTVSLVTSYKFLFKPLFKVDKVLKGSPADIVGIKKGDFLVKINGKSAHNYTLDKIVSLFQSRPKRKIKLIINRGGLKLKFVFRLKQRI